MQFNFSSLSYQLFSTDFQLSLACWNFCNVCCYNIKLICIWHKNCECFLFGEKFWFEFLEMSSDKRNNIFHNFWKSGQRVYQTFQNFLTGYFHSIWLFLTILDWMVFIEISETFPGTVCTICSCFEIFGIFDQMESTCCFTSLDCHLVSIPKCHDMKNAVWPLDTRWWTSHW